MTQALYLIRGVPGSGKTTEALRMAEQFTERGVPVTHLEADAYFINEAGEYQYNPAKISHAHAWCRRQTQIALDDGDVVIVSNTFTKNWELEDYINRALAKSIPVHVIQCNGEWDNVHGVPPEKVQVMRDRFEDNAKLAKLWESHDKASLVFFK